MFNFVLLIIGFVFLTMPLFAYFNEIEQWKGNFIKYTAFAVVIGLIPFFIGFSNIFMSPEIDSDMKMNKYVSAVIKGTGDECEDFSYISTLDNNILSIKVKTKDRAKLVFAHQAIQILPRIFKDKEKVDKIVILWMDNLDGTLSKIAATEMERGTYREIDWNNVSQYEIKDYIRKAQYLK